MRRRTSGQPPALPSVNLLSEPAFQRIAARRVQRIFVVAGVVLLGAVGVGWGVQHSRVVETRRLVAVEQAETTRLTAETQLLAPIRTFVDGVAVQQRASHVVMADEVYLSDVLDGLQAALPIGARLATVGVTVASTSPTAGEVGAADAATCPGPDPFNTRVVIGCVTLSGSAVSRGDVGTMVIALGDSELFVEPFISTTTVDDGSGVAFSGSVGLSEQVHTGRYDDPVPASDNGRSR